MKQFMISLLVLLFLLLSCGKSEDETIHQKELPGDTLTSEAKTPKEMFTAIMTRIGVEVPPGLVFEGISNDKQALIATYSKHSVSDSALRSLTAWYESTIASFKDNGWRIKTLNDNEKVMGLVLNKHLLYPPEAVQTPLNRGMSLGTTLEEQTGYYRLTINADW
jgi:hypothetical protein